MKCFALLAITVALLIGSENVNAQSNDTDVVLGAAAGAAIGSTVGQGDGKKIATVIGGLIGAEMARNSGDSERQLIRRLTIECKRAVPSRYAANPGVKNAWIEGCVNRERKKQLELEQLAYEEAFNGAN